MSTNFEQHIRSYIPGLRKVGAVILLESQKQDHPASQNSYLAAKPSAWIKAYGDSIEVMRQGERQTFRANPWEALKEFRSNTKDWMFGYLGYDLKNFLEKLSSNNDSPIETPDLYFMVPDLLIHHQQGKEPEFLKGSPGDFPDQPEEIGDFRVKQHTQISAEEYQHRVRKAKDDIHEGDYYEINLSHPLQYEFEGDPWSLYLAMRERGPVPFGSFMSFDELTISCASPERFLKREGSKVISQPIKGTATRLKDEMEDRENIRSLKESEKERAENLMIVDLVRNDLSRVVENNTVRVSALFDIQSFETVHQMVSTIEGTLGETADSIEVIKACFPMGSMTGAPKIASMQAIERYEQYKRGIYSGAVGYFKPNGDFDFNVVIRTAIIQNNKLIYPVGGAITSDSEPEAEWEETLWKAKAITDILKTHDFD